MKKYLLLFGVLSFMPLIAQSDVSLDINMPGINLHLGDQDKTWLLLGWIRLATTTVVERSSRRSHW